MEIVIHSDEYNEPGYKKYFKVHCGILFNTTLCTESEFSRENFHINGIEIFRGYVKNRLVR